MSVPEAAAPSWPRMGRDYGKKVGRFLLVSVFNVGFGQSLLVLSHSWLGWSFAVSNLVAVSVSAGPAYVLARYWVWRKRSKNHLVKEVLPFWGLAFLGLLVSTIAAGVANRYSNAQIVLNLVNLGSFGIIWVFKFFILDRFMFGRHHPSPAPIAETDAATSL
jgi:putative flippase GtrA